MIALDAARVATNERRDDLIDFTRRIVATPSLSGEEGDVASLIVAELKKLKFDEVWTDEVGNVIGKIKGGKGSSMLLNGHMDVVDPGPHDSWPHPPYSGEVVAGELWGRGSVDMKGPVAAMIYAVAQFKQLGIQPPGDVLMTVAVMEEICGLGSQFMANSITADAAIIGEPCNNQLRLGHRGRLEIQVRFFGRSAHASAPHLAVNPHFAAANFLNRLGELRLDEDDVLGQSTIAPTLYQTDQVSSNVIPSEVVVFLDWRNVPSETTAIALRRLENLIAAIAKESSTEHSIAPPAVSVTSHPRLTYTGVLRDFEAIFPPFATTPNHVLAEAAARVISASTGKPAAADVWKFATDGGHWSAAEMPCIGFGPGNDSLAHTNQERISVDELCVAAATYAPLVCELAKAME